MRKILGILIFLSLSGLSYATHQVGGYISFKWLGGFTYQVTFNDYTNTFPYGQVADRDGIRIFYDDGTSDSLVRSNGLPNYLLPDDPTPNGEPLCNYDFSSQIPRPLNGARKYNVYQGTHTFPGPGSYHIYLDDQDRMIYINNILNSVNVDYYAYSTLTIPFGGAAYYINSPLVTNPPVCQYGCIGQCYTYNPGAYIPNLPPGSDDSISYQLGNSLQLNSSDPTHPELAQGYFNPGASVNDTTGTLTWCPTSPGDTGIWNFVILMITYQRESLTIGGYTITSVVPKDTVELELEVIINSTCYSPTVTSKDTCVVAGGNVDITYTAKIDNGVPLYITAMGEPFSELPPATLSNYGPQISPLVTRLNWSTNCTEVRETPYEVVIRATEKVIQIGTDDSALYSGYGTSLIKVVGPPPRNLKANVEGTTVCLHWDPSICPQVNGYNIYRAIGCVDFDPDVCTTGVPSYTGYSLIGTNAGLDDTTFCDSNSGSGLAPGARYSYIVDATYPPPDGSQSLASNDTCILIKLGVPVITNVSVTKTDPAHGEMFVRWIKPIADSVDLDTTQYPPPYTYVLKRAQGMKGVVFAPIDTVVSPHYNSKIDTTFMDLGLDTRDSSYNYKIDFFYGPKKNLNRVGSSGDASSIYLRVQRENKSNKLGWSADVPWTNDTFYIYKLNPPPAIQTYNFLAKTTKTTYTDSDLHNGSTYCYYVKSVSEYTGATSIPHPLYDSSETMCGTPEDTIAPCAPPLNVAAKCLLYEDSIIWNNPDRYCPEANKTVAYQIYFTPVENGDMNIIATINNPEDTIYVNGDLTSVAGCYAVVAVDSAGQTSPRNNVCVDNCPNYELPNVFTPNGDGVNDLFTPLEPYRYVKDIDINIYNRWGQVVFHSTNPSINWNGNVDNSGGACPDGVYYYICIVNEIRVTGIVPITLKGFIQLIRN